MAARRQQVVREPCHASPARPHDAVVMPLRAGDGTIVASIIRYVDRATYGSRTDDPVMIVAVDGDVDRDTAPALRTALSQALDHWTRVCFDMTGVAFFGAAGVHVLIAVQRQAADLDRCFFVTGVHGIAAQVFAIAGLDNIVVITRRDTIGMVPGRL